MRDKSVSVTPHGAGFDHKNPPEDFDVEYVYCLKPDGWMLREEKCVECGRTFRCEEVQATNLTVYANNRVLYTHGKSRGESDE